MTKPARDISRLLEIMAALREPETGCPWDLEQDFKSIAPYTVEEAYEVADAIERGDMEDLRLELGDLLLQPVYHAQMASEAGHFDFGDVVEGITAKMIRRHPHVFGTADKSAAEYSAEGLEAGTWERIKSEEKAEEAKRREELGLPQKQPAPSILADVPTGLPALTSALKLQKKAAKTGFDWDDPHAVLAKIKEEIAELEVEMERGKQAFQQEELGDLLFTVVNLARHLKIDPEQSLRDANSKFTRRFNLIEQAFEYNHEAMNEVSLEVLEEHWVNAKNKP